MHHIALVRLGRRAKVARPSSAYAVTGPEGRLAEAVGRFVRRRRREAVNTGERAGVTVHMCMRTRHGDTMSNRQGSY